jgi:hypothetical protein
MGLPNQEQTNPLIPSLTSATPLTLSRPLCPLASARASIVDDATFVIVGASSRAVAWLQSKATIQNTVRKKSAEYLSKF